MFKKVLSIMLIIVLLVFYMPIAAFQNAFQSYAAKTTDTIFTENGEYQIPYTGYYDIEVAGAAGGDIIFNNGIAYGAQASSTKTRVHLQKNQILNIEIGEKEAPVDNTSGSINTNFTAQQGEASKIIVDESVLYESQGGNGAVYHKHTGNASTGGGCYSVTNTIPHVHTGSCYISESFVATYSDCPIYHCEGVCDFCGQHLSGYGPHTHYRTVLNCRKTYDISYSLGCEVSGLTKVGVYDYYNGKGTPDTIGQNGFVKITAVDSPDIEITPNTINYTKEDVKLTANILNNNTNGTYYINWTLPNGETAQGSEIYAQRNGLYKTELITNTGLNIANDSYEVTNIDKLPPIINSVTKTLSQDKKSEKIDITAYDQTGIDYAKTGLKRYALSNNLTSDSVETGNENTSFTVTENGSYILQVLDQVDNEASTNVDVRDIEINIKGNIQWIDDNDNYNLRKNNTLNLYRKIGENGVEELAESIVLDKEQTNYNFQVRQCDDDGNNYIYRLGQADIPGYETTYSTNNVEITRTKDLEINITNRLILPKNNLSINVEPYNSFNNLILKNGQVKITAVASADRDNKDEVGLSNGMITFSVDPNLVIDLSTLKVTYEDKEGTKINIDDYTIENNVITSYFGNDNNGDSKAGDKVTIEAIATVNSRNFKNILFLDGKFKDYRAEVIPTILEYKIEQGTVAGEDAEELEEYQLPEAKIQIRKVDSITEESLSDATFTLYEWNGTEYIEKEIIKDDDNDGLYESGIYRWDATTQGRYKVIETGIPENHRDSGFTMEYVLSEIRTTSYVVNVDHSNVNYAISYGKGDPDNLDRLKVYVENEPYKLKAKAIKIDEETGNIIKANTEFKIYEWDKTENTYKECVSHINSNEINMQRQTDETYLAGEWLYYTSNNEGKYRIVEAKAPEGYYGDFNDQNEKRTYDINILDIIENGEYEGQTVTNGGTIKIKNMQENKIANKRVKAIVDLTIVDKDTKGAPQTTATLEGAKYGIYALETIKHADGTTTRYEGEESILYKPDDLVQIQYTNEEGKLTFDNLECGKYYIQMIEAPEGYILDETKYAADLSYQGETVSTVRANGTLEMQIIKQAIQIYKVNENNEALNNAGFSIYLVNDLSIVKQGKISKKAENTYILNDQEALLDEKLLEKQNADGTFDLSDLIEYYYKINYKEDNMQTLPADNEVYHPYNLEKETLAKIYTEPEISSILSEIRTNEEGKLTTPELPYGEYAIIETSVPLNFEPINPFITFINEDNREPKQYGSVTDKFYKSRVKIYTKDINTNNPIIGKTAFYAIKNIETEEYMTAKIWNGTEFETKGTLEKPFESRNIGYFITPMELPVGKYALEQVTAPNGYVKNNTIQEFKIDTNNIYYMENYLGKTIIVMEEENQEALGTIKINTSRGEQLYNATENEGQYKFEYINRPIEGNVYKVCANEDIYKQDGSGVLIYEKDEIIDYITTNNLGEAQISNLPIGRYYIQEVSVVAGYSLREDITEIEIAYEGQEIPIILKQTVQQENRQKINIIINNKDQETGEIRTGGEYGLYTQSEIKYIDDNGEEKILLPNVKLITLISNDEGKIIINPEVNLDLPRGEYYLKEEIAPKGYVLQNETLEIDTTNQNIVEIINVEKDFFGIQTNINVVERNEENTITQGSTFELIKEETNELIKTWTTNGEIENFKKLETDVNYIIRETNPVPGYTTSEEIEFYINEMGDITYGNKLIPGANTTGILDPRTITIRDYKTILQIEILDEETKENSIGSKWQIIKQKENTEENEESKPEEEIIYEWTTKDEQYLVEKLPIGEYILRETDIGENTGYVTNEEIKFSIEDTKEIQTLDVEDNVSKLQINIIDEETKEDIKNVTINIQDENGKIIASTEELLKDAGNKENNNNQENIIKIKELEEGGYYLTKLPVGKYKIEKISPDGYKEIENIEVEVKDILEKQIVDLETRKLIFDVSVKTKLKSINIDGEIIQATDEMMKVEIKESKVQKVNLELTYTINIVNEGEVEATVEELLDQLPSGLKLKNDNLDWKVNNENKATYNRKIVLEPKEEKQLEITVKWENSDMNFGEKKNTAQLKELTNVYEYKEANLENNISSESTLISVKTGLQERDTIVTIISIILTEIMIIFLIVGLEVFVLKKKTVFYKK